MHKIKQKRFKEVKQYGLGGDFGPEEYDALYDDNEIFKGIYNKVKIFEGFLKVDNDTDYKDAKDLAETIFDYIIDNYGGVPKKEKLDKFLDALFEEDTKFFKEIMKPLLDAVVSYIDYYMENSLEYIMEDIKEVAIDNFYSNLDNKLDIGSYTISDEVETFLQKNHIKTDDIPELLENVIKTYRKNIDIYIEDDVNTNKYETVSLGDFYLNEKFSVELPSICYEFDSLSEDYIDYIKSNCSNPIKLKDCVGYTNYSEDSVFVCYFDDIKEYILEYADDNNLIE